MDHRELRRLRDICMAATPGPRLQTKVYSQDEVRLMDIGINRSAWWVTHDGWLDLEDDGMFFTKPDAQFAATFTPTMVLALLEALGCASPTADPSTAESVTEGTGN